MNKKKEKERRCAIVWQLVVTLPSMRMRSSNRPSCMQRSSKNTQSARNNGSLRRQRRPGRSGRREFKYELHPLPIDGGPWRWRRWRPVKWHLRTRRWHFVQHCATQPRCHRSLLVFRDDEEYEWGWMIRRLMPGLINVIPKTSIKELTLFGICSEVIGDGQGGGFVRCES
jgi:hypothetical protein